MKVECPVAVSSAEPTRVKMRSHTDSVADDGAQPRPLARGWRDTTWRMSVDLPALFGPVTTSPATTT